jgi:cytochrome c-type biogenesis protein CcmH
MMLWFVLALMSAAAIVAVIWPLARPGRKPVTGNDLAVYRDQLDEIKRDRAAGLIGENEAEAASVEVSRRLLAAADAEAAGSVARAGVGTGGRRAVVIAALLLLSLGSVAAYLTLGSPFLPAQLIEAREQTQSFDKLVAQVEEHLARNPKDGRGWEVIAPVYLRLGRYDDAIKARRNALALNGETSERLSALGEALTAAAQGAVPPEAQSIFGRAVESDSENVKARFFLGLAAEQEGRPADAIAKWRAIIATSPADAPWVPFIRSEIARLAGNGDDIAAADNESDQRNAMIRGMVDRLAERLSRDGSDLEGWVRLVRSYVVLGEQDKAKAAASSARRALASEPDKVQRIDELVKGLGLEG